MKEKWPKKLNKGNTIGFFAPSEPLWGDRKKRLQDGEKILRKSGFNVYQPQHLFAEYYDSAGTLEQRLEDLTELFSDPKVHALGGAWGGKSANELLENFDYELCVRYPKPMFGFSDVCVLLNAITSETGLITFFGPNVVGKLDETKSYSLSLLKDSQHGKGTNPFLVNASVNDWTTLIPGDGQGRLFGGNLSTFVLGLTGSRFMESMQDCLFFWESAGETPQIIKQHLVCLRNSGFFNKINAMIVGDVRWPPDGYEHQAIESVIEEVLTGRKIPVFRSPTFGHAPLPNPIIPIGAKMRFSENPIDSVLL